MPRSRRPQLSQKIIDDNSLLGRAIEGLVTGSSANRIHQDLIRTLHEKLEAVTSPEAWTAFLEVEQATNDRAADLQDELVRWAFRQGHRVGRQRRQPC